MTKQEFLSKLQSALVGRLSSDAIMQNIKYYEDYINSKIRMGEPEQSVLDELGDPRLIAKSIIAAATDSRGNGESDSDFPDQNNRKGILKTKLKFLAQSLNIDISKIPEPLMVLGKTALIIGVVIGCLAVFSLGIKIVFSLISVFFPILVVVFLIKLFTDWLK